MLHHMRQNWFAKRGSIQLGSYSPDLAPSDYNLFASTGHAHAGQRFGSYEDVRKWIDKWFAAKGENFIDVVFTNCQKDERNV